MTITTQHGGISFNVNDARVFSDAFEEFQDVYGDHAPHYMKGFALIWIRYRQLKDQGFNVKISTPRLGRRQPLLIISCSKETPMHNIEPSTR